MKKTTSTILLLAALAAALLSAAFPVAGVLAREATDITLIDVRYSHANGFVFTFSTNGQVTGYNLPASVTIDGNSFPLDCVVKNDENLIVCHTTRDLGTEPGDAGSVTLLGQTFPFSAPKVTREPLAVPVAACPGQSAVYHVDAVCEYGSDFSFDLTVSPGENVMDLIAEIVDFFYSSFDMQIIVNSVTFVGCQP